MISDFRTYQYSSYLSVLSSQKTELKREEVLEWFGGLELFVKYHLEWKDTLTATRNFEDFL